LEETSRLDCEGGVPQLERSRRFFATGKIRLERLLSESDGLFEARHATPNYAESRAISNLSECFRDRCRLRFGLLPAQEGTRQAQMKTQVKPSPALFSEL
jgi:hypothetical protein